MPHTDATFLVQWFNLVRGFCFGLSGAYDTLGSQAYGSGNKVITTPSSCSSLHCPLAMVLDGLSNVTVMMQVLVMSWAITASFAMLLMNVPISVGMWYAGDAARVIFQQVPSTSCVSAQESYKFSGEVARWRNPMFWVTVLRGQRMCLEHPNMHLKIPCTQSRPHDDT